MDSPVARLGAWCDFETEDEARQRLLAGAALRDDADVVNDQDDPRPGKYVPYVPIAGVPVLSPHGVHFRVEEFAVLADGRRIRLHAERGFTLSGGVDPWEALTLENLDASVRATVLPDDAEDTGEDHPWEWLSELLLVQGIGATAEQLQTVPYDVEFSDRLRGQVPSGA